jgi:hypothetical protein
MVARPNLATAVPVYCFCFRTAESAAHIPFLAEKNAHLGENYYQGANKNRVIYPN